MKPHLRYLKYVLLHKAYVFRAGLAIGPAGAWNGRGPYWLRWLPWLWRLLIHDLSKFRPSEWTPYVHHFYGVFEQEGVEAIRARQTRLARFNQAWLFHQHRNAHHWQHWVLREDSGKTIVLLPPPVLADEMLADWLGAGSKVLRLPSFADCVAETITWYVANRDRLLLRDPARLRIEGSLTGLAARHLGVTAVLPPSSRVTVTLPMI